MHSWHEMPRRDRRYRAASAWVRQLASGIRRPIADTAQLIRSTDGASTDLMARVSDELSCWRV